MQRQGMSNREEVIVHARKLSGKGAIGKHVDAAKKREPTLVKQRHVLLGGRDVGGGRIA
jgi:hypothetical protein